MVPMKDAQTAIGMVLVEAGSHYEDKEINGLSHFLEHMCFKGTKNRSGNDIKLELDGIGAQSNAFTGTEYTGYYAKAHYKKLPKIVDLISDIYQNSTFPEKDIESEKGVIIEEINMYEDSPERIVSYVWNELLYGDQPAGRRVIGTKENIRKFQQKDFIEYHKTHYVADKTVVVVAGQFDGKEILSQIKDSFKNISTDKPVKKPKVMDVQDKVGMSVKYKKTDQTHLILGFRSFKMGDKRNPALRIAATILGQGFSSRLFSRMRDELGICYYTYAYLDTSIDVGDFTVGAGVANGRVEEAISVIIEELKHLRDFEVPLSELKKAKELHLGRKATSLETSDQFADFYGFQELLHQEILNPTQQFKKLKDVTAEDVRKAMKQIVKEEKMNLAMVGPFKDSSKFSKLLKL